MSRKNKIQYNMKTNKVLLGGIAGGVAFFLLGWLIYGILFKDYMTSNYNQCAAKPMEEMVWWAMIVSNLAYGFLLALIFSWSNTTGIMAGAKVAFIVGLLICISMDFSMYSMSTMFPGLKVLLIDVIIGTVMITIVGAVVVVVMDMVKKAD
jgi:hypothetical protein